MIEDIKNEIEKLQDDEYNYVYRKEVIQILDKYKDIDKYKNAWEEFKEWNEYGYISVDRKIEDLEEKHNISKEME